MRRIWFWWQEPTQSEKMPDQWFVVELACGEPGDPAYIQPVRADRVEQDYEHLRFVREDNSLVGLFLRSVVRKWREASADESQKWDRQKAASS